MGSTTTTEASSTEMASIKPRNPSLVELPLFLRQIPDIVLEIASHLPTESAMCLSLTCKPLYGLLFRSTSRKLRSEDRLLTGFLFILLKDLQWSNKRTYLCHHCSKLCVWKCPAGGLGRCAECPVIGQKLLGFKHEAYQDHACITSRSYFTYTFNGVETDGDFSRWVMHRQRGGFRSCCGKGPADSTSPTPF